MARIWIVKFFFVFLSLISNKVKYGEIKPTWIGASEDVKLKALMFHFVRYNLVVKLR